MKCLCCGKSITNSAANVEKEWCWHKKCVKRFFQTDELPILDVTKDQLEILANETVNEGLTVPGVQKKLSLHLSTDLNARLTIVDYPTGYILKPQTEEFHNMPEFEDLAELFLRVVGSFVMGNSDMHLKNFSPKETEPGRILWDPIKFCGTYDEKSMLIKGKTFYTDRRILLVSRAKRATGRTYFKKA